MGLIIPLPLHPGWLLEQIPATRAGIGITGLLWDLELVAYGSVSICIILFINLSILFILFIYLFVFGPHGGR